MLRNTWLVARRELSAIFVQPIAYAFGVVVLLISGVIFANQLGFLAAEGRTSGLVGVSNVLSAYTFLFMFAAPAITMRLLAEERRSGTLELLLSLPLREWEIGLGKFTAAFLYYASLTSLTFIYPILLANVTTPAPDRGPLLTGYLGVLLWGATLLAIGLLASAITESQLVAFVLSLGVTLTLYLIANLAGSASALQPMLEQLSLQNHLFPFLEGLLRSVDLAYHLGITAVFLFLTILILQSQRWWSSRNWRTASNAAISALLAIGSAALLIAITAQNAGWRIDVTETAVFTPPPETITLLNEATTPVQAIGFYTPFAQAEQARAQQQLDNLAALSPRFSYQFADPEANPLLAQQYGVQFDSTIVFVQAERSSQTNSLAPRDVHAALLRLLDPDPRVAYFLTGHGERSINDGGVDGLRDAADFLRSAGFTVNELNLAVETAVPADANVLLLIDQFAPLQAAEIDAIATYLNNGGSLFLARDPVDQDRAPAEEDGLAAYLGEIWGVGLRQDVIFDQDFAQAGQIGFQFLGAQYGLSPIITADLSRFGTIFAVARSVATSPTADVIPASLVLTSELAWGETNMALLTAGEAAPNGSDANGPLVVGSSLQNEATGARLVIFGDSDFIDNELITAGGNNLLFSNAVGWLAGNETAVSLPTSPAIERRILLTQAQLRGLQLIGLLLPPLLLLAVGGRVWWRRRK